MPSSPSDRYVCKIGDYDCINYIGDNDKVTYDLDIYSMTAGSYKVDIMMDNKTLTSNLNATYPDTYRNNVNIALRFNDKTLECTLNFILKSFNNVDTINMGCHKTLALYNDVQRYITTYNDHPNEFDLYYKHPNNYGIHDIHESLDRFSLDYEHNIKLLELNMLILKFITFFHVCDLDNKQKTNYHYVDDLITFRLENEKSSKVLNSTFNRLYDTNNSLANHDPLKNNPLFIIDITNDSTVITSPHIRITLTYFKMSFKNMITFIVLSSFLTLSVFIVCV